MWRILHMPFGLLVLPLLVTTVASLSTDFRSDDWHLENEKPPTKEVHLKPKHPPKEQLFHSETPKSFLHRPEKGAQVRRVSDFTRLLRGPSKGAIKVPIKSVQAPVLRGHGALKPFGTMTHHEQEGPVKVTVNKALLDVQRSGLRTQTKGLLARYVLMTENPGPEPHQRRAMPGQPMALRKDVSVGAKVMHFDSAGMTILAPTVFVLVMLALIFAFTFCFADSDDSASDESLGDSDNRKLCYPKSVDDAATLALRTANTKEKLLEFEHSPGTWARTYRKADKNSKEALELLFRCNIIPVHEFAESFVSQEHIDECVWISTQMLREKSLEEWVEAWPQAMKTFEESVTACFAARTDVISNLYGQSPPNSPQTPRSDRGFMDCRHGMPTPSSSQPRDARSNASTGRAPTLYEENTGPASALRNVLTRSSRVPHTSPLGADSQDVSTSQRVSVRPPHATVTQTDSRISVVSRCREIMSSIPTRAGGSKSTSDAADESAAASAVASPASTSPSMHFRDLPIGPPSVDHLGRLESYPPSEAVPASGKLSPGPHSPDCPVKVESSAGLSGTTPMAKEKVPKGGFSGLLGSIPKTSDRLQSSGCFGGQPGTTSQPIQLVPSFNPTSSFGLSGTTPQPKELAPRGVLPAMSPVSEARSLSPRDAGWPRGTTPLFGRPAQSGSALASTAPFASSSEDPFASLKDREPFD